MGKTWSTEEFSKALDETPIELSDNLMHASVGRDGTLSVKCKKSFKISKNADESGAIEVNVVKGFSAPDKTAEAHKKVLEVLSMALLKHNKDFKTSFKAWCKALSLGLSRINKKTGKDTKHVEDLIAKRNYDANMAEKLEEKVNQDRKKQVGALQEKLRAKLESLLEASLSKAIDSAVKTFEKKLSKQERGFFKKGFKWTTDHTTIALTLVVVSLSVAALVVAGPVAAGVATAALVGTGIYLFAKSAEAMYKIYKETKKYQSRYIKGLDYTRAQLTASDKALGEAVKGLKLVKGYTVQLLESYNKIEQEMKKAEKKLVSKKTSDKRQKEAEDNIKVLEEKLTQLNALIKDEGLDGYIKDLEDAQELVKKQSEVVSVKQSNSTKKFLGVSKAFADALAKVLKVAKEVAAAK